VRVGPARAVWVPATPLATTFGVVEGVNVNVGETLAVALAVPVVVFVTVTVLVKVAVWVKVGDGVKVLVGGTNWVGVAGSVRVGPPGVTVGAGVVTKIIQ